MQALYSVAFTSATHMYWVQLLLRFFRMQMPTGMLPQTVPLAIYVAALCLHEFCQTSTLWNNTETMASSTSS